MQLPANHEILRNLTVGLCRACLIYGALPPETRRNQARRFNDNDDDSGVMVASDAVGMGLNLNIGRIIFSTLRKQTKSGQESISMSQIKQIAGILARLPWTPWSNDWGKKGSWWYDVQQPHHYWLRHVQHRSHHQAPIWERGNRKLMLP